MLGRVWLIGWMTLVSVRAQSTCEGTPAYSPCELAFELSADAAAAHPQPYRTAELRVEFRSPRFRTYLLHAFWDGGRRLIVRFVPTEPGAWTYRTSGNVKEWDGQTGAFTASESDAPGYVHPANVHHWATENKQPHLWMGRVLDGFATMPGQAFEAALAAAEAQQFNHIQAQVLEPGAYLGPDRPNLAYFAELDRRVLALHKKRICADLMLAPDPSTLAKTFPDWQSRKRYVQYLAARYGALNITWQGVREFEGHRGARALLKEIGLALKELDPYQHPRSTNAKVTSSPFLMDGWMDFVIDHSGNDQLGAVEHQFYQTPFIGVATARRLWNSTMNGQYPMLEGPVENEPKLWFSFMSDTRHWELEPYFDVDAARCVALEGIEYVVLVEKSGPVEVEVEKHGYDVSWVNPLNGASIDLKKYKGEHFTGSPPDTLHPWILLIAREGRKESMLRSYKFESRIVPVQEIEQAPAKVPFEIVAPAGATISSATPALFTSKLKRETRATRSMMYLWTVEAPAEGQGFRVLGTGPSGTFAIPPDLVQSFPGVLSVRLSALNANGKSYFTDKVYQLTK